MLVKVARSVNTAFCCKEFQSALRIITMINDQAAQYSFSTESLGLKRQYKEKSFV